MRHCYANWTFLINAKTNVFKSSILFFFFVLNCFIFVCCMLFIWTILIKSKVDRGYRFYERVKHFQGMIILCNMKICSLIRALKYIINNSMSQCKNPISASSQRRRYSFLAPSCWFIWKVLIRSWKAHFEMPQTSVCVFTQYDMARFYSLSQTTLLLVIIIN